MPITTDTNQSISFSQLKSEYVVNTTSCSYSQLKRGGSFVDNSKNIEATDVISSINSYTLNGTSQGNTPLALGYANRYMYGDLTTYSGSLGSGGIYAYGYLYNSRSTTSSINASTGIQNGANGASYPMDFLLMHMGTSADINEGGTNQVTEILTATIGRAGTYYFLSARAAGIAITTLQIEVNTGSGFSTVFGNVGGSISNISNALSLSYTLNASVGDQIRVTLYGKGNNISRYYYLSTSNSTNDKTMNVLLNQNVPTNATLAASNGIALSDFYGGENA